MLMTAKIKRGMAHEYPTPWDHDHLQKTNTKQNPPKIKTSIGHTGESGFGYVVGRQEGEKAHLDLFVCFNAPRAGDIPRHPLITTLMKKKTKKTQIFRPTVRPLHFLKRRQSQQA